MRLHVAYGGDNIIHACLDGRLHVLVVAVCNESVSNRDESDVSCAALLNPPCGGW